MKKIPCVNKSVETIRPIGFGSNASLSVRLSKSAYAAIAPLAQKHEMPVSTIVDVLCRSYAEEEIEFSADFLLKSVLYSYLARVHELQANRNPFAAALQRVLTSEAKGHEKVGDAPPASR
jgi:hypothetical protein